MSTTGAKEADASPDFVIASYDAAAQATQAATRLQVAGIQATTVPDPSAVSSSVADEPPCICLQVRHRDVHKARGVLRAFRMLPHDAPGQILGPVDEADEESGAPALAPTDDAQTAASASSEESGGTSSDTDSPSGRGANRDAASSTDDEEQPADEAGNWMPSIGFGQMVAVGALLLALATAVFLWMNATG